METLEKKKWIGPKALLDILEEKAIQASMRPDTSYWEDFMCIESWLAYRLDEIFGGGKCRPSLIEKIARRFP